MKPNAFNTILFTALMVFTETTSAASCRVIKQAGMLATYWEIKATGVEDVPGVCGGLWDNLKRFPACIVVHDASCRDEGSGRLRWYFGIDAGCNNGMVQSTWWEATKNKYGAVGC